MTQRPDDTPITISMITVVYNRAQTIQRAVDSILNQHYTHLQYVVIDGGSTDGTLAILQNYGDRIDVLISEPDHGIYDAMNKGISYCTGQYIGILNSDDWMHDGALNAIAHAARQYPQARMLYGQTTIQDDTGRILRTMPGKRIRPRFIGIPFDHQSCYFKRSVYEQLGLFDTSFKTAADYDFILRFLRHGGTTAPIGQVTNHFRAGGVTSQWRWPVPFPADEVWRALRNNGYSPVTAALGIAARILSATIGITKRRLTDQLRTSAGR